MLLVIGMQVSEKASSEASLIQHQEQLKTDLNQKLLELQQMMKMVEVLKTGKEDLEGMAAQCTYAPATADTACLSLLAAKCRQVLYMIAAQPASFSCLADLPCNLFVVAPQLITSRRRLQRRLQRSSCSLPTPHCQSCASSTTNCQQTCTASWPVNLRSWLNTSSSTSSCSSKQQKRQQPGNRQRQQQRSCRGTWTG